MARLVHLWNDLNFTGYDIPITENTPVLPPPYYRQATSMKVQLPAGTWAVVWETENYSQSDDSWWIESPGDGYEWNFPDLRTMRRPHGNNNWNDRIAAVSFSPILAPPDVDNAIILHSDGSWSGNLGLLAYKVFPDQFPEVKAEKR